MWNIKNCLFASALAAVSFGHSGKKDWGISKMNVTDSCKSAMRAVQKPNATECSLPNREPASLDKFCPNIDKCVDWAKKQLQEQCKDNMNDRRVKFSFEYGVRIRYTNTCLKDSKNEYCRIRWNDKSKCGECQPKFVETVKTVMKDAPADQRDKALNWLEKVGPCTRKSRKGSSQNKINSGAESLTVQSIIVYSGALTLAGYTLLS
jgi:hypothetical protein